MESMAVSQGPSSDFALRLAGVLSFGIPLIAARIFPVGKVSDQYFIRTTPPGVFFAIWAIIYTNFMVSSVYGLITDTWLPISWVYFITWNVISGIWSYLFSSGTKTNVFLSEFANAALFLANLLLWQSHTENPALSDGFGYYVQNSFTFCLGWLVAANNLGIGINLVYSFNVSLDRQVVIFWILAPICYELVYLHNFTVAPFASSIGLIITTLYALTGAAISTVKPWPKEKEEQLREMHKMIPEE